MELSRVWRSTLSSFARTTSIAGVNQAGNASSWPRAIYWALVFVIFFTLTIVGLVGVVQEVYTHPFDTITEVEHETSVQFPAVTFCNLNRINCDRILDARLASSSPDQEIGDETAFLIDLFDLSGCRQLTCEAIAAELRRNDTREDEREGSNLTETELRVLTSAEIFCDFENMPVYEKESACSILLHATDKVADAVSLAEKVEAAWAFYSCEEWVDYLCSELWDDGNQEDPDFLLPGRCGNGGDGGYQGGEYSYDYGGGDGVEEGRKRRKRTATTEHIASSSFSSSSGENEFMSKYMKLGEGFRESIGHSFEGFVKSCNYAGLDCMDSSLWYTYNTPSFGNCFVFNFGPNSKFDPSYPRDSFLTGMENGLTVELFLDRENYAIQSRKAGIRVVVHDSELAPLPDEYGVDLQPNTASSIAVRKSAIERLESPFKAECMTDWEDTGYNITTSMKYSFTSCRRFCVQRAISTTCDCSHSPLVQHGVPETMDREPCDVATGATNLGDACIPDILAEFASENRTCNCRAACKESEYSTQVSSSAWSPERRKQDLAEGLYAQPTSDFVQVNIYFQTLSTASVKQKEKYTFNTLVSSLGGALSLYLGMAVVLFFEVIELAFDLVAQTLKYLGRSGKAGKI